MHPGRPLYMRSLRGPEEPQRKNRIISSTFHRDSNLFLVASPPHDVRGTFCCCQSGGKEFLQPFKEQLRFADCWSDIVGGVGRL